MRRVQFKRKQLTNTELLKGSVRVSIGCKRDTSACSTSDYTTCGFPNRCIDRWTHHECQCVSSGVVVPNTCLRGQFIDYCFLFVKYLNKLT